MSWKSPCLVAEIPPILIYGLAGAFNQRGASTWRPFSMAEKYSMATNNDLESGGISH